MKKVLLILILSLAVSGCLKKQITSNEVIGNNNATPAIEEIVTKESYQDDLKNVLMPFWSQGSRDKIKEQILGLTVPSEYLDLHFNLVIAFEMIEQGSKDSDQEQIDLGLAKIDRLAQEYSWLQ